MAEGIWDSGHLIKREMMQLGGRYESADDVGMEVQFTASDVRRVADWLWEQRAEVSPHPCHYSEAVAMLFTLADMMNTQKRAAQEAT